MGHAAYHRGSKAIAAQIDQLAAAARKPDHITLLEARARNAESRAEKAEAALAASQAEMARARRSLRILRLTLEQERATVWSQIEEWKARAQMGAKYIKATREAGR